MDLGLEILLDELADTRVELEEALVLPPFLGESKTGLERVVGTVKTVTNSNSRLCKGQTILKSTRKPPRGGLHLKCLARFQLKYMLLSRLDESIQLQFQNFH